jgi:hypothetical protein
MSESLNSRQARPGYSQDLGAFKWLFRLAAVPFSDNFRELNIRGKPQLTTLLKTAVLSSGAALALILTGCSTTPKATSLAKGGPPLQKGKQIDLYRSAPQLNKQSLARIYLEPVEIAKSVDPSILARLDSVNYLNQAVVRAIETQTSWKIATQPQDSTAKLKLTIDELTPGSRAGRIWAAELGAGHAIIQIEGALFDSTSAPELAAFADKRRDSGAIGFEDTAGDAGPTLINRLLESISSHLVKEILLDVQQK